MYKLNALLEEFYNSDTLNIFSDASIIYDEKNNKCTGCYGVVCVTRDTIIDQCYHLVSDTTNNNSEIKGIRAALSFANIYRGRFKYINIFSDSKISIDGLRDYIYRWSYNPKDGLLYTSTGKPAANQAIFIECNQMMNILGADPYTMFCLYHQNGHINDSYRDLCRAANTFSRSNNIYGKVDINLIRYISTYNDIVDKTSRSILKRNGHQDGYMDPIQFYTIGKVKKTTTK